MRRLIIVVTGAFWLLTIALWLGARLDGDVQPEPARPLERTIERSELSGHASPTDCWMAIRGEVYGLSAYLPDHPSSPEVIEPWCGKEATQAYETKTKGRPHSARADQLLASRRIGRLAPAGPAPRRAAGANGGADMDSAR